MSRKNTVLGVAAVIVIGCGAAALGTWLYLARPWVSGPSTAGAFDADHTAGVVGLEHPHELLRDVAALVDKEIPASLKPTVGPFLDPTWRREKLGFDPAKPEDWATIGLDPTAGFAMGIDGRVGAGSAGRSDPRPILVVKVTDRAKLLTWLKKIGLEVSVEAPTSGIEVANAGGKKALIGQRGEFTAIALLRNAGEVDEVKAGFAAYLRAEGKNLARDGAFRDGMSGSPKGAHLWAWGGMAGISEAARAAGARKKDIEILDFVATLLKGAAYSGGTETQRLRVLTTDNGHAALKKLLKPDASSPRCALLFPKRGWTVGRFSVNLVDLFDGVLDLAPPSVSKGDRDKIAGAKMGFAMLSGMSWDDIAGALSGHVCFGADTSTLGALASGGTPGWLGVVGTRDNGKAEAFAGKLANLGGFLASSLKAREIAVKGSKGLEWGSGPLGVALVRTDGAFLLGPNAAALASAMERSGSDSLDGSAVGKLLDGDAIFAYGLDVTGLIELAKASLPMAPIHLRGTLDGALQGAAKLPGATDTSVTFAITLERIGLEALGQAHGPVSSVVMGFVGATLGSYLSAAGRPPEGNPIEPVPPPPPPPPQGDPFDTPTHEGLDPTPPARTP